MAAELGSEQGQRQETGHQSGATEDGPVDLNQVFPEVDMDLNAMFPDRGTRELLRKVKRNQRSNERFLDGCKREKIWPDDEQEHCQ
jgi:hypothetical protein